MVGLSDEVFWDSSLRFICKQLDLYVEQNEKTNNKANNTKYDDTETYKIKHLDDW